MKDETSNPVPQNGPAIREIRQREGMSVSDAASKAGGFSASHWRNIELENRPASPERLARMAKALGCQIAAIRRERIPA